MIGNPGVRKTATTRPGVRVLIFVLAGSLALVVVLAGVRWQRQSSTTLDPYASIPFRPVVTYESWNVSIRNPETEPYLNTSLRLYVGGTLYTLPVGTIQPGETVTRSLLSLTNEHGAKFNPNSAQLSELEVRANFRGYETHKDFPLPKATVSDF